MTKSCLLLFVFAALSFGASSEDGSHSATASAAASEARVTVFFSKDMATGGFALNKTRVYVDGRGRRLPGNRFFTVELPVGQHEFSSGAGYLLARREHLDLNLKPGDHLYLLEGLETGLWRARIALRVVSCTEMEGRHLGQKLKPISDKDGIVPETKFPECSQ